jgi:hypothetical protein
MASGVSGLGMGARTPPSYEWATIWAVGLFLLAALLVSLPVGLGPCGELSGGARRDFCQGPRWIGLFVLPPFLALIGGMLSRRLDRWGPFVAAVVLGGAVIVVTAVLASSLPRLPS